MSRPRPAPTPWWTRGVIYQVYPRSYQDTDGDGVGDLAGIRRRLDHLAWLGVDAMWLSPIYPSPMRDFGYDVTDFTGVDPLFGDLAAFDALVAEAHARDIRVVLDAVPNHTSDEHPWFLAASSSRRDPKRAWYIWRDPAPDGGPPNNWRAVDGLDTPGSVWRFHQPTEQYYLATFSSFQPDLDWRHAEVRDAVSSALRFWLERGVDGFRLDMVDFLGKDPDMRDEPPETAYAGDYLAATRHQLHTPTALGYIRELRRTIHAYPDRVMIGEILYFLPPERIARFYAGGEGLDLPFNFGLVFAPMRAGPLRERIDAYDRAVGQGWPNYDLANHDMPRLSRHGPATRAAVMLLLTLRGTPFLYYGDEIGMANVDVPPERRQDPFVMYQTGTTRDGARTPMQWTGGRHAGFSEVEPWLPVAPDAEHVNVEAEREDPTSMLWLHRRLLAVRRAEPALQVGSYRPWDEVPAGCLAYLREHRDEACLVILNLTDTAQGVQVPADANWQVLLSTTLEGALGTGAEGVTLRPYEGVLLRRVTPRRD